MLAIAMATGGTVLKDDHICVCLISENALGSVKVEWGHRWGGVGIDVRQNTLTQTEREVTQHWITTQEHLRSHFIILVVHHH